MKRFSFEALKKQGIPEVKELLREKLLQWKNRLLRANKKRLIALIFPYFLAAYFVNKVYSLYRVSEGQIWTEKLMAFLEQSDRLFESWLPSRHPKDLFAGILGAGMLGFVFYYKKLNAKKFRKGEEYGSARWGTEKDIKPYMDPVFENNVLLSQTERLTMNSRPKNPKYARNKNILVVGGSGSGKTRFFIKPNLMQCESKEYPVSFVVTDPKGTLVCECGKMLLRYGYRLKILNTINFKKSMRYNPFVYIKSEKDILKFVNTLIANTKGEGAQAGEDFWVKAEQLYYCALIGYIWYEGREEEKNMNTLIELINASETREDDENFKNAVDYMFEDLEKENPQHFAVRQYKKYKLAAGKTAKSILISCGARLAPFDIQEVRDLMMDDELELDTMGDKKTALFIIMADTDSTFSFIIALLQSQLYNLLCDKADDEYGGSLPVHVRFLLDEAANIGKIPQFEKLVAVVRSRNISICPVLQAKSQLKGLYKDHADTIIGNMDSEIFLGGKEEGTLKSLSEMLGKQTLDLYNESETRSNQNSHGINYQKVGRELASQSELGILDGGKCVVLVRGVVPFLSEKYDITKHPNYRYLADSDKRNWLDVEKYLSTKARIRPGEEIEIFEYTETEE